MQRAAVPLLLFGSGACALIYQTAWLREFRLVFGASTAATSAVLAIFMGGLGLGGLLLGRRADRSPNPLAFYGNLEVIIAVAAAVSPLLILGARGLYIMTGGSAVMGLTAATAVRLLLATIVLAVPTFLMGGTLPAAARAVERESDLSRRALALIYGTNTVGAVAGTLLSTFAMLERFGTRRTLWIAALANILIGLVARQISRGATSSPEETAAEIPEDPRKRVAGRMMFVLCAAATVGFAFLLMELVWYRMLAPLLGGSTFTFGLILALALFGIGLGGVLYSWTERREPTLIHLAITCALEALFVALPLAFGDRIAILALLLRPVGVIGFNGLLLGWTAIASFVVVPAAIVAGFQFPLLIALLGQGRKNVGRDVGLGYLWNTIGAILGSLAGGFGLLPLLSAPGAWRAVVIVLLALAAAAIGLELLPWRKFRSLQPSESSMDRGPATRDARPMTVALGLAFLLLPIPLLFAAGPSAVWRHSGIGAGRAGYFDQSRNGLRDWANRFRRHTIWESDGVESSVALSTENGLSFIINGKNDGNARADAATQVMSGLLGALLHGRVKTALVIGMGTGSTSGWLGALPGITEVHTVELERDVLHVARECSVVNRNALDNPRIKVTIGDAREVLLTVPEKYDLIFSEPSNPYRAGIASLFTREFYSASADRLAEGGMFVQWLQAYEVDTSTVLTVVGTLGTVFPAIEVWYTKPGDLLLIGSKTPRTYDVAALRERITTEPFRSALFNTWRASDLEGVLAHFVARGDLPQRAVGSEGFTLNTDDRNVVEFGFARSVGAATSFDRMWLRDWARANGVNRPELTGGAVNWEAVEDRQVSFSISEGLQEPIPGWASEDLRHRHNALTAYLGGNLARTIDEWGRQPRPPMDGVEMAVIADSLAERGDARAFPMIEVIRRRQPCEADAIEGLLRLRQGDSANATALLIRSFVAFRRDPWPLPAVMRRALFTAEWISAEDSSGVLSRRLYDALAEPFAAHVLEEDRQLRLVTLGRRSDPNPCNDRMLAALHDLEPHVPWKRELLEVRQTCYLRRNDPRAPRARAELREFLANEPSRPPTL